MISVGQSSAAEIVARLGVAVRASRNRVHTGLWAIEGNTGMAVGISPAETGSTLDGSAKAEVVPAHVCLLHEGNGESWPHAVRFCQEAMASNEQCVWVTSPGQIAALRKYFPSKPPGVEVPPVAKDTSAFLEEGALLAEKACSSIEEWWTSAKGAGRSGLRLIVHLDEILTPATSRETFENYENRINRLVEDYPIRVLCILGLPACPPDLIAGALASHQAIIFRKAALRNPYFSTSALPGKDDPLSTTIPQALAYLNEQAQAVRTACAREQRYRVLTESLPDVITAHRPDGTYLYASPATQDMFGFAPGELIGLNAFDFMHPDDTDRIKAVTRRAVEQGIQDRAEYRRRHRDGHYLWVETTGTVHRNPETGAVEDIICVVRNVDERHQAEDALARRDRILEALRHAATLFLESDRWRSCVDEVLRRLGEAAEVSRVHVFERHRSSKGAMVASQRFEWCAPGLRGYMNDPRWQDFDYRHAGFARWEQILKRNELLCGHIHEFPQTEQHALSARGVKSILVAPLFVKGSLRGFISFEQVDTEREWSTAEMDALQTAAGTLGAAIARRRTEKALKEQEGRYRHITEAVTDYIYTVYVRDGRAIRTVHGPACEAVTGYASSEFQNDPYLWITIVPEADQGLVRAHAARVLRGEASPPLEHRLIRRDGTIRWVRNTPVPHHDIEGRLVAYDGLIQDITERREAEERVRASLAEKEVLLKEIHHRVKNNLQVMSSLFDLQLDTVEDETAKRIVQDSRDRVRAMALIHERLYQSHDLTGIDAEEYIRSLVDHLSELYSARDRSPELQIQVEGVSFDIDLAIPCGLLINEMVSNALKHGFPPGHSCNEPAVCVALKRLDGANFQLEVRDTGVGLPENVDVNKASSLGLQLVSMLARQLRGSLNVERENGTAFLVRFPAPESSKGAPK